MGDQRQRAPHLRCHPWSKKNIIGYKDYYVLHKCVLCTPVFSTSAVAPMIDNSAYPPGSTELDDKTGHNCQMPRTLYRAFYDLVFGLLSESWVNTHSEAAFRNMLLQDLDAICWAEQESGGTSVVGH